MSRTDKDRPYWVRLNDDGVVKHDHTFVTYNGKTSYTRYGRPIRDEDGNPVKETVYDYRSAEWIAEHAPRTKEYLKAVRWPLTMQDAMRYTMQNGSAMYAVTGKAVNPLWQKAQELVNQGRGDEKLVYGSREVIKRKTHTEEIPQYCTGENDASPYHNKDRWAHPCTKVLPRAEERHNCSCSSCEPGGLYAEKKSRTAKKNTLRAMAKAYDGSDDWQDEFEEKEMYLSKPLRYTSQWC